MTGDVARSFGARLLLSRQSPMISAGCADINAGRSESGQSAAQNGWRAETQDALLALQCRDERRQQARLLAHWASGRSLAQRGRC